MRAGSCDLDSPSSLSGMYQVFSLQNAVQVFILFFFLSRSNFLLKGLLRCYPTEIAECKFNEKMVMDMFVEGDDAFYCPTVDTLQQESHIFPWPLTHPERLAKTYRPDILLPIDYTNAEFTKFVVANENENATLESIKKKFVFSFPCFILF